MKTPKRNQRNGYEADCFLIDGPNQTAFEHARWKRKNRIRQLKATIAKYKLWYEATRDILRNVSLELKAMQDEYLPK